MNHHGEAASRRTLMAVALDVDRGLIATLSQAFARGNVELVAVPAGSAQQRSIARAQGCFLPLNARSIRSAGASSWFVPRQTMLYALGASEDAVRFAHVGINALVNIQDDLSLRAAVDTTRNLLSRGFDDCSRIPIVVPVRIQTDHGSVEGLTRNLGCGGMAVRLLRACSLPARVNLAFELPGHIALSLPAMPRWYSGPLVGFQFCPSPAGASIKRWVFRYSRLARSHSAVRSSAASPLPS